MEWGFPIEGPIESSASAIEAELRATSGMFTADVDIQSRRIQVTFDADEVCGGEILSVLKAYGCTSATGFRA